MADDDYLFMAVGLISVGKVVSLNFKVISIISVCFTQWPTRACESGGTVFLFLFSFFRLCFTISNAVKSESIIHTSDL